MRVAIRLLAWLRRARRRANLEQHTVTCRDGSTMTLWLPHLAPLTANHPAPPSQQPHLALAAAARASLDEFEMQDDRGEKRDAHARTPPPPPPPSAPPPPSHGRRFA